jgi:transcriptional regulator with XRE-family HTH domain
MNDIRFKPRTFTETLTLLCKAKGGALLKKNGDINQSEIARLAGINQPNVSRWYHENHAPHNESVLRLSRALKVTPAQIRGEMPIDFIDGYYARSHEDEILMNEISSLPENLKNMIREQVAIYKTLSDKN